MVKAKIAWVVIMLLAAMLLPQVAEAVRGCPGELWFESAPTGRLNLTPLEPECRWDQTTDNKLQTAGTCSPKTTNPNRWQVLTHNHWCDWLTGCPAGAGWDSSGIALLKVGMRVRLCAEGRIWDGTVQFADYIKDRKLSPQDPVLVCTSPRCGTAVTSYGQWWPSPGVQMGYWLVWISWW